MTETLNTKKSVHERLADRLDELLAELGYELVHFEVQTHRQKILRLFIDRVEPNGKPIGIEDCVNVTHALDIPLENLPEMEQTFRGQYELEVSSPGLTRPLRKDSDYNRFSGQEVRIHVFRPLTQEEIENPDYLKKNPKQKNFLGKLKGLQGDKVQIELIQDKNAGGAVMIPLPLISKANLEPDLNKIGDGEQGSKKRSRRS